MTRITPTKYFLKENVYSAFIWKTKYSNGIKYKTRLIHNFTCPQCENFTLLLLFDRIHKLAGNTNRTRETQRAGERDKRYRERAREIQRARERSISLPSGK